MLLDSMQLIYLESWCKFDHSQKIRHAEEKPFDIRILLSLNVILFTIPFKRYRVQKLGIALINWSWSLEKLLLLNKLNY